MIIKFGQDKDVYNFGRDVFVSRPFFKILFNNGFGIYIFNSFKFRFLPKFYGTFHNTFWEFGVSVLGWTLEVMWNKHFRV